MNILKFVTSNPDIYQVYKVCRHNNINYRLLIRKTVNEGDTLRLIGQNILGIDHRGYILDNVIVIFDITSIISVIDSLDKGIFLTAFPVSGRYTIRELTVISGNSTIISAFDTYIPDKTFDNLYFRYNRCELVDDEYIIFL